MIGVLKKNFWTNISVALLIITMGLTKLRLFHREDNLPIRKEQQRKIKHPSPVSYWRQTRSVALWRCQIWFGPWPQEITEPPVFAARAASRPRWGDSSERQTAIPRVLHPGQWALARNGSPGTDGFHCKQLFKSRLKEAKCSVFSPVTLWWACHGVKEKGGNDFSSPIFKVGNSQSCRLLMGIGKEISDSQDLKCQFSSNVL